MAKLNKNKTGLVLGIFVALIHAIWAVLVAVIPASLQKLIDWAFLLHSLKPIYVITSFILLNAVFLVVMTFIVGYVLGWVFAAVWNWLVKK
jgi:hypothetical protein